MLGLETGETYSDCWIVTQYRRCYKYCTICDIMYRHI